MDAPPRLPDLLSLVPEGHAKAVLRFALNDLGLSSEEIPRVLYDAQSISEAINLLMGGGVLTGGVPAS
ncbi:MAG: hypothetical protein LAP40_23485 [Acidobacteriia bacterium]|nr:hypothetical protein [Terriglobia bacterium]